MTNNDITNEFLTSEEVRELTGTAHINSQIEWLKDNAWHFTVNRKNRVIIGRWYARTKLSGVIPKEVQLDTANEPYFDRVS
ncbi:DUF4224 domain-containing protein [Methylophaga sp. OBS3]|uniref:DUF4224 domain-containing protein n=1 Tax=Methylophaga sp. OBS3 TaxID=2991934 RepID=UPI003A4D26BA